MTSTNKIKALWANHTRCEFELRDPEATMATMTANPLVNGVPNMMGGNGYDEVYHFYKHHFIPCIPEQTEVTTLSCTVSDNRLVDEQIVRFVHDRTFDFFLPNIEPTGKTVVIPVVVIVYFENDKVDKEHVYWDQASLLKQIGYFQDETLPILGVVQAQKMFDRSLPANQLLMRKV